MCSAAYIQPRICGTKLRTPSRIQAPPLCAPASDKEYRIFFTRAAVQRPARLNNHCFYQNKKVIIDALSGPGRRSLSIIVLYIRFHHIPCFFFGVTNVFFSFRLFFLEPGHWRRKHREIIMVCRRATLLASWRYPHRLCFSTFIGRASLLCSKKLLYKPFCFLLLFCR